MHACLERSFGESPFQQHIGLGNAASIESLEVWWPTSDTRQLFEKVAVDRFIQIKEFEKSITPLRRPSFHLGGGNRAKAVALKTATVPD